MTDLVHILIVEHDLQVIKSLLLELKRSELRFTERVVQTKSAYTHLLKEEAPDVILANFALPFGDAFSAFDIRQNLAPEIPFIVYADAIGEENVARLIKTGITDYIPEKNLGQLAPKLLQAVAEAKERKRQDKARQELLVQEQELRTQYELVSDVLFTIPNGFIALTPTHVVTYWNHMAEQMLQVPKEKILGKNPWKVFSNLIPKKFTAAYSEVIARKSSVTFEDFLAISNSWYEVKLSYSENGVVVFLLDITGKKRKEQLLLLEKEMLEGYTLHKQSLTVAVAHLLNGINRIYPEMSLSLSKVEEDRLYDWVNPHLAVATEEVGEEEEHGFPIHTTPFPSAHAAAFKQVVEVRDVTHQEDWKEYARVVAPFGIHTLVAYPLYDVNHQVIGVLSVFFKQNRGISQAEEKAVRQVLSVLRQLVGLQMAESAMSKSEQKYRILFHASPTPMWVYDSETFKFLDVNAAAISHYGYSDEEFKSMTLFDIRPKEEHLTLATALYLTSEALTIPKTTFRHRTKAGKLIWVDVQARSFELKGRKARLVLATDVTEALQHTHAMEEQNAMLREIAWMQSHVVRAPVARIMGLATLLNKSSQDASFDREIVSHMLESTKELDVVIRSIVQKAEQLDMYNQTDTSSAAASSIPVS